jgi:hypothetical protein
MRGEQELNAEAPRRKGETDTRPSPSPSPNRLRPGGTTASLAGALAKAEGRGYMRILLVSFALDLEPSTAGARPDLYLAPCILNLYL